MSDWRYQADKVPGTDTWMIKRFHSQTTSDDESDFDEAEIVVATDNPEVAIQAAVDRDSWS